VQELSNFFERRVSAYQVAVTGTVTFDEDSEHGGVGDPILGATPNGHEERVKQVPFSPGNRSGARPSAKSWTSTSTSR
jgi:hypothetical protein